MLPFLVGEIMTFTFIIVLLIDYLRRNNIDKRKLIIN